MPIKSIQYDDSKLRKALRDFRFATGININILDENFSSLLGSDLDTVLMENNYCACIQSTEAGMRACSHSDRALLEKCKLTKHVETHVCHAGLIDVGVPIIYDDKIIAYIILGQMKKDEDFLSVERYIAHLPLDFEKMRLYYEGLVHFNIDRINSVASIAEMLAKMILLEHILRPSGSKSLERAESFIVENLDKPLSIEMITKSIGVSKSVLYREFHERHNCTVNEYVNRRRVEKSIELLLNTDLSVEEISQRVGFGSAAYFTVNFKREKGIAPLKFRKNVRDKG